MSNKITIKNIEREINSEFCCLEEEILLNKQKIIANLINSMDAKQFNLFKKYISLEKKLITNMCKDVMHRCIKTIIENPEYFDFSNIKKDPT